MIDDDHDRDSADYDNKKVVADGDGNVFQYLDLMTLCRVACEGKHSNDRPKHAAKVWRRANIFWNSLKLHLNRNEINTWDFVVNFWSTFDHIQNGLPAVLHFGKSRRSVF